jgi:diketogulonate reductase-like aldo/keto reductase
MKICNAGASKSSQLEMNLAATNLELTSSEVEALDELTASGSLYPNWMLTMFPDTRTEQALRQKTKVF